MPESGSIVEAFRVLNYIPCLQTGTHLTEILETEHCIPESRKKSHGNPVSELELNIKKNTVKQVCKANRTALLSPLVR